jgi:hypothetical protein
MIPKIRAELDADIINANEPTEYATDTNRFQLPCGVCGKMLFVDRETLAAYEKALLHDLDNQFICADCEREYEDSAYE